MRTLLVVAILIGAVTDAGQASGLTFRRADGSTIVFRGTVRAWCDARRLQVLTLAPLRSSRWQLSVPRRDALQHRSIAFTWERPRGVEIFVFDAKTGNEASDGAEPSHGIVEFRRATCARGGVLEISVAAILASEFSGGKPIRVSGTYVGRVGTRPTG